MATDHPTRFTRPIMQMVAKKTSLNATVTSDAVGMPTGVIESVTPILPDAAATIPHGRVYMELLVVDPANGNMPMFSLWRGYASSDNGQILGVSSTPFTPYFSDWAIQAVVTQTGRGVAQRVGFHIHVNPNPATENFGSGFIFAEAPRTGPGETVSVAVAQPAAGAEYAVQTVPACATWLLRSMQGTLTTSAAVANRGPQLLMDDGANEYGRWAVNINESAGGAWHNVWSIFGGLSTLVRSPQQITLPEAYLPAGHRISWSTISLDVADQWSAGRMLIEEWAVPS